MGIPNLKDNIVNKDFKIENFIDIAEAKDFMSLPGIEDIVFSIQELFGAIGAIIGKILQIIQAIMSLFGLTGLFNSEAMKKLFGFIFSFINGNMSGFGFSASTREEMKGAYVSSCMNFNNDLNSKFGFRLPNIFTVSLIGVLMALICNGVEGAYSSLYNLFKNKNIMSNNELDGMFSRSVGPIMNQKNDNSRAMIEDISTTDFAGSLLTHNPRIARQSVSYLNADKGRPTANKYDSVVSAITSMDSSFGNSSNISGFKGASMFKSYAASKNSREVNASLLDNPNGTSGNLGLSVLSLF